MIVPKYSIVDKGGNARFIGSLDEYGMIEVLDVDRNISVRLFAEEVDDWVTMLRELEHEAEYR